MTNWRMRALDLGLSTLGLLVAAPLIAVVAFAVYADLGRPVLFTQIRAGRGGRPFEIRKFRTMTNDRDEEGELLPDEDRLTSTGQFLRATALDELPELWNVLRGDMSIVGPRPLHLKYVDRYDEDQARRLEVKPGLTSWAVVNGRNELSWEERLELDRWYVENRSLWLDVRIILRTTLLMVKGEGVSAPGSATMPEFKPETDEA
jgi:lipopolysaccharide/colanic/teichoic acid biosynthesis glycosyltransferase